MKRKSLYKKIDEKIMKSRFVKALEKKIEFVNKLTEGKDDTKMNLKSHTFTRTFTPMENKLLGIRAGKK